MPALLPPTSGGAAQPPYEGGGPAAAMRHADSSAIHTTSTESAAADARRRADAAAAAHQREAERRARKRRHTAPSPPRTPALAHAPQLQPRPPSPRPPSPRPPPAPTSTSPPLHPLLSCARLTPREAPPGHAAMTGNILPGRTLSPSSLPRTEETVALAAGAPTPPLLGSPILRRMPPEDWLSPSETMLFVGKCPPDPGPRSPGRS
jgi:hypothetical protein